MNKKITCGIFGLVAATVVGVGALAGTQQNFSNRVDADETPYSETWTSLDNNGKDLTVTTTHGNKFTFSSDAHNPEAPCTDGLITLNKDQYFNLETPVGSIKSLEVGLKVDGKDYVFKDGDTAPLLMNYEILVYNEKNDTTIKYDADAGFRTSYTFTSTPHPSLVNFTSQLDKVTITSLTLNYVCKHETVEHAQANNDMYIIGSWQASYAGSTHTGIKCNYNGDKKEHSITLDLYENNKTEATVSFRYPTAPNAEKLKLIENKDTKDCAVRNGLVALTNETTLTVKGHAKYTFYITEPKEGFRHVYVINTQNSIKNWYLAGNEYEVDGVKYNTDSWKLNDKAAALVETAEGSRTFEIKNVKLAKNVPFKIRNDVQLHWINNLGEIGQKVATLTNDNDKNIIVNEDGTYNIKLNCQFGDSAYIDIEKVA